MIRQFCVVVIGVVLACASYGWAIPITVDGVIDGNDSYAATLSDATGEPGLESSDWDISQAHFDLDANWLYMGLETVGGFDRNGGNTSLFGTTLFLGLIDSTGSPHSFGLVTTASSVLLNVDNVMLTENVDYVVGIGSALELKLDRSRIPTIGSDFAFQAQLDDNGSGSDDQIAGQVIGVPEPATMALLAVGGVALLRRKR
ncbi:MAG TPA: PEP-CTERM sorting domain-containing protein [Phycisphaerae bacterium]|nr:PEP-CTERM sorting domain-containing protein [Phycisphaerae bacterium]